MLIARLYYINYLGYKLLTTIWPEPISMANTKTHNDTQWWRRYNNASIIYLIKGGRQHQHRKREKENVVHQLSLLGTYSSSPPFLKNLFLFLSPRKIYLKTCVLVGCWTIDGLLSLFCSASSIPSFRMFTPRTHSSGPPHRRRKKSKCAGHFKSSGCCWVLLITSYCVRSTLIISRPLSPYVHDALR